jgi:signal transduction histidine kinase
VQRSDGSTRWLSILGRTFFSDGGTPVRATGVVLDITEQKLREETLRRHEAELRAAAEERQRLLVSERTARSDAERANRLKDEFIAVVSHEIRTPLNSILGWVRLLSTNRAESATAIPIIERNARAQRQLIDDLLDMEQILSGRMKFSPEAIRLQDVVTAALNAIIPAAAEKQIALEPCLESAELWVCGDALRLQQVFFNLLTNSVKFTNPGGKIRLILQRAGNDAALIVRDTGEGITPSFLPHVFDFYRQGDVTRGSNQHHGLGIGLAIAKHITDLHGGSITAESEGTGSGATFRVTLPLTAPDRPASSQPEESQARLSVGGISGAAMVV